MRHRTEMTGKKIGTLLLATLMLTGCRRSFNQSAFAAPNVPQGGDRELSSKLPPEALELWRSYLKDEKTKRELQPGCEPLRLPADQAAPYRGTALLFHGFLRCPQQLYSMANTLSKSGYEVLLPLVSGHGREPGYLSDNETFLPGVRESENSHTKYAALVDTMNKIVEQSAGEHVVGGLSFGASLAARAATIAPARYSRAILISPLFGFSDQFHRRIGLPHQHIENLSSDDPRLDIRLALGEACEQERDAGRVGYCDYRIDNIAAMKHFSSSSIDTTVTISTHFQILGMEDDPIAGIQSTLKAIESLRKVSPLKTSACFFAGGASSSSLTRFDAQSQFGTWLDALFLHSSEFLSTGAPYPEEPQKSMAGGHKLCRNL